MTGQDILYSFFLIFSGAAVIATCRLVHASAHAGRLYCLGRIGRPLWHGLCKRYRAAGWHRGNWHHLPAVFSGFGPAYPETQKHAWRIVADRIGDHSGVFYRRQPRNAGFGFSVTEAVIVGIGITFSSTILGVKLLPTTVLHHRHVGEIVISLLLVQDLFAIVALILIGYLGGSADQSGTAVLTLVLALPILIAGALISVRFAILPLLQRFDDFHEYIFLLAIGWCLAIAQVAHMSGLSYEVGGFIAGVSLATSPIAQYIANHLKPLRDFFLVMFFFTVGASINLQVLSSVWMPIVTLAAIILLIKPWTFRRLLNMQGETLSSARKSAYA